MRYYKESRIILSEDTSSDPKCQKFSVEDKDTDLTLLVNEVSNTQTYAGPAAHVISLGLIAEVRWFYIKADQEITIEVSGGPAMTLVSGKPNEMWVKGMTSLTINTTVATRIALAIAGS